MKNEYIIFDEYAEIIIYSDKFGKFNIKIDLEDIDICKNFRWGIGAYRYKKGTKEFYYATNSKAGLLHRYLMKNPEDFQIDHKNRDTLDCRKENLRMASSSQQGMNGNVPINNTSGYVGVTWVKKFQRWMSHIRKNGKQKNLGYYKDIVDAITARKKAEEEYFGKYKAE